MLFWEFIGWNAKHSKKWRKFIGRDAFHCNSLETNPFLVLHHKISPLSIPEFCPNLYPQIPNILGMLAKRHSLYWPLARYVSLYKSRVRKDWCEPVSPLWCPPSNSNNFPPPFIALKQNRNGTTDWNFSESVGQVARSTPQLTHCLYSLLTCFIPSEERSVWTLQTTWSFQ